MNIDITPDLLSSLEHHVTEKRRHRFKQVLNNRTRHIVCVLEDLFDPGNGSAVLRHCDALGIQEVHVIEHRNRFRQDKNIDMGSSQWLDVSIHPSHSSSSSTPTVLESLKSRGYRIIATTPNATSNKPENLDITSSPIALVFGTEKHGVSDHVLSLSDNTICIPMYGFVDSLNISAAAAIIFHTLIHRLRCEQTDWHLSESDSTHIYSQWIYNSLTAPEELIKHYSSLQTTNIT